MPLVSNKQKFDKREQASAGSRNSLGFNGVRKLEVIKCSRYTKSKNKANNDVMKMNEGSREAALLPIEVIHSLSNIHCQ